MNIKKTKIALALGGFLFMTMPLSSAFAHEEHCEIQETELGNIMTYMKGELRAYVKGVKDDDPQAMQQHLNELLKLSAMAAEQTPTKIKNMHASGVMDHSQMSSEEMAEMDHSQMSSEEMAEMDHSQMSSENMPAMDHGDMNSGEHDMSNMPSMEGMSADQHHQHMLYLQGMTGLQDLFKALEKTQDKTEIKTILGKIKTYIQHSHQQFRQNC